MMSENKFFDELMKDVEAHDAAMSAAAAGDDQETAGDKDTYTRAEVDALIAEKIKEVMEGNENGESKDNVGNAGNGTDGNSAGSEGGKENE